MKTPRNAVVVGVTADGIDAALSYAVQEARRWSRPLHLVHVLQLSASLAYAVAHGGLLEAAQTSLDDAVARAEQLSAHEVSVTSELVDGGSTVEDLSRRCEGAALLVCQHRGLSRLARVVVGSVAHGVAGRAPVPVVSVPEGWVPREDGPAVVTVAVQDPVEAPALVRLALDEARAREARLVVLRAWWLGTGYDLLVADDDYRRLWATGSGGEIEAVLAPLRETYPDVAVTVDVRHAPAPDAVLDASERSDLLVLGRRHHLLPLGSHLGPVARAALDHAACPVLISPELPVARRSEQTDPSQAAPLPAAG